MSNFRIFDLGHLKVPRIDSNSTPPMSAIPLMRGVRIGCASMHSRKAGNWNSDRFDSISRVSVLAVYSTTPLAVMARRSVDTMAMLP